MSVDMGESLVFSYLKHIKCCKIVQTNWKISDLWESSIKDEKTLEELRDRIDNDIDESTFGGEEISKILKQAECDAIGISFGSNNKQIVCAVDVAFHRDGLGYGSEKINAIKVVQKCVRTAMCIYKYYNADFAEIIFATPKIKGKQNILIKSYVDKANQIVKNVFHNNYEIKLIYGDDFKNEILEKVKGLSNSVNDTSEYFLRCYQLEQMFAGKSIVALDYNTNIINESTQEVKVGWIANNDFRAILEKLNDITIVNDLLSAEYSKSEFLMGKPILVKNERKDTARYYAKPLTILGETYYLCNDWYERNRIPLEEWMQKINN